MACTVYTLGHRHSLLIGEARIVNLGRKKSKILYLGDAANVRVDHTPFPDNDAGATPADSSDADSLASAATAANDLAP
ncbi:hypothetical protein [Blastopirellula retiformator]|nr:hypothetical protein [Blastopirellula retiformator]